MMAIKPLNATEPMTVTSKVNTETITLFISILSPTSPAMEAAVGASSRPMMETMAPIAAGGKMKSIHFVPIILTINENRTNNRPNTMKPDWASE